MKRGRWNVLWGALLVIAGGLTLLEGLGVLAVGAPAWAVLFAAASVAFSYGFVSSRDNWWAAIPAGALLGLAALIASGELAAGFAEVWGASLFLGALGMGFWAVYLRCGREFWWAIIPGGVLLTISLFVGLSSILPGGSAAVSVFFFGLALTFAVLSVVPTEVEGRMRWPLIPAGVLGVLGVLFAVGAVAVLSVLNYLWPVAVIVGGLYLILRAFGSGRRPTPHR